MKETAYKFNYYQSDLNENKYTIKDYSSYYYGNVRNIIQDNFNLFEFIEISDNERLENICYNMYNSEDYSDLLVMINEANFLWMIPYDIDIQLSIAESYKAYLTKSLNNSGDEDKKEFIEEYSKNKSFKENSQKRKIIVPKAESIQDVESLLSEYRKGNQT